MQPALETHLSYHLNNPNRHLVGLFEGQHEVRHSRSPVELLQRSVAGVHRLLHHKRLRVQHNAHHNGPVQQNIPIRSPSDQGRAI